VRSDKNQLGIGSAPDKPVILAGFPLQTFRTQQQEVAAMTLNQDDNQKEIPITMNGIEVMNYLSLDPQKLCFLAKEGHLVPHSGVRPSWFKLLIGDLDELKRRVPGWLYLKSDVEAFKLNHTKYLEGQWKQKANSELLIKTDSESASNQKEKIASKEKISDEKRDKNKDITQCRETARKHVTDCNAKGETPYIATAINIIRSLDFGSIYTKKQIRNWITKKPEIFPKESSKKGRRKNS